jgi:hypothetical protein
MIKMTKKWAAVGASAVSFLATRFAMAETSTASNIVLTNPLTAPDFTTVLNNFLNFLFTDIVLPLMVIMVLVGAIQFMTSAGNPEKVTQAKNTLIYAAIGVAVALLATSATSIIKSILGQ